MSRKEDFDARVDLAVRQALHQLPALIDRYRDEIWDEHCSFAVRNGRLEVTRARDGQVFTLAGAGGRPSEQ